jgi:hypothetical protein
MFQWERRGLVVVSKLKETRRFTSKVVLEPLKRWRGMALEELPSFAPT